MAKSKGPKHSSRSKEGNNNNSSRKRKHSSSDAFLDADDEQRDEFFEADDAEQVSEGEEDAEPQETAAEKRLRLARDYLQQLRGADGDGDGAASDEELDAAAHAALGERLKQSAAEAAGYLQRKIAHRLVLPQAAAAQQGCKGRLFKCHRLPVTALALTSDDRTAYSVSKDGSICRLDVETGQRSALPLPGSDSADMRRAEWVPPKARSIGKQSFMAAALSSDDRYLALGGGDSSIHIWDCRSQQWIQALKGRNAHRDVVSGLAFRDATHELYSCSFDRTVKLWSLDDMAYVDTLFGHQQEVLAIDAMRQERVLTSGHDHTCRVWKIPEESQLIFRSHGLAVDCCRYITGTEWVTGASDGSLAMWSQMKKRPTAVIRAAHGPSTQTDAGVAANGIANGLANGHAHTAAAAPGSERCAGAGGVSGDAAGWIGAVTSCRGSDLMASGAGDGLIRLWQVADGKVGKTLQPLGGLPARGFVNALQLARSGRFLLAGMGQEPRLGRWARDPAARNGLLLHQLQLRSDD